MAGEETRQIVKAQVQGKKSDGTFEDIITDDAGRLQVKDPKVGSLISYEGATTADGAGDGSTLVCSDLTTKPDFDGNLVIITSGAYAGQARDINGITTGGTVTPSRVFGGQIVSGTNFVIVGITTTPAEVAAIEAKLDHAAYGLAALKALIDAVEGKLDGVSGLAAIKAVVDAILVDTGTTLEGKLDALASICTAARLGELDAANIPADIDPLLGRLTAARAGYLNNINNANLGTLVGDTAGAAGTFAFDESSASEQTVFSIPLTTRAKVGAIWLDLNNLTMNNTIRVKHKIDGATYRTFSTNSWVFASDDKGVLIEGFTAYRDFQVTMQCAGGGAAGKNIPYAVV
jgi:hypothetical protein